MDLPQLMRHQDGVISRRQVLQHGLDDDDIARQLRRRTWARLFQGVYVDHTGLPTWRQRAWGAVLVHAPAALDNASALAAWGAAEPATDRDIEIVVMASRRVDDPPGVRTRRTRTWERDVQLHLSPPRVRLETAALRVAARATTDEQSVAVLADLVQRGRTTGARLRTALTEQTRLPRRRLLDDVLVDVSSGALSALERRYLRDVERAHALPSGRRQVRVERAGSVSVRDVEYSGHGLIVELDGRLGHELWRDRWADLDRDLLSLVGGTITARAGWAQVLQPCRLAETIAAILTARGWDGAPRRCDATCTLR